MVNVEYMDVGKIIFILFDGFIDFRIKDLVKVFKILIELCQIGVLDEGNAKWHWLLWLPPLKHLPGRFWSWNIHPGWLLRNRTCPQPDQISDLAGCLLEAPEVTKMIANCKEEERKCKGNIQCLKPGRVVVLRGHGRMATKPAGMYRTRNCPSETGFEVVRDETGNLPPGREDYRRNRTEGPACPMGKP